MTALQYRREPPPTAIMTQFTVVSSTMRSCSNVCESTMLHSKFHVFLSIARVMPERRHHVEVLVPLPMFACGAATQALQSSIYRWCYINGCAARMGSAPHIQARNIQSMLTLVHYFNEVVHECKPMGFRNGKPRRYTGWSCSGPSVQASAIRGTGSDSTSRVRRLTTNLVHSFARPYRLPVGEVCSSATAPSCAEDCRRHVGHCRCLADAVVHH